MDQFLLIIGVIWLAVISPGADFAMVSRLSFFQGRQAGVLAAAGIAVACWFHIAYAVFGLALIERWFPNMLEIIKIVGAGYLIYLGVSMTLARPAAAEAQGAQLAGGGSGRVLLTGILTNGLNPKTSIFVVSLYAQAIGPQTSLAAQLGYGLIISLSHLIWFCAVACFLSQPAIRAQVMANQRIVNSAIGCIMVVLGLVLAWSDLSPGA